MPDGDIQSQLMGYDRASTLFSPEGRIFQVEYAEQTVKRLGASCIGLLCKDGIVIISDKRALDPLLVSGSMTKIYEIDDHIIAAASGILSDARVLLERAQLYAQQHRVTYNEDVEVEAVIRDVGNIMQAFTQYGGARPFGVEIIFGGVNTDSTPRLYFVDVTGNFNMYYAIAIGEHDEKIKEMLKKEYKKDISINEAIKLGIKVFKKVLGKDFSYERLEVAFVDKTRKNKKLTIDELKEIEKK